MVEKEGVVSDLVLAAFIPSPLTEACMYLLPKCRAFRPAHLYPSPPTPLPPHMLHAHKRQVCVHKQGFEHYRRSLLRDIAAAEARVEAQAAARAAKRAKERADRVGKHSRRGAQARVPPRGGGGSVEAGGGRVGVGGSKDGIDAATAADCGRNEAVASVFGKKSRRPRSGQD